MCNESRNDTSGTLEQSDVPGYILPRTPEWLWTCHISASRHHKLKHAHCQRTHPGFKCIDLQGSQILGRSFDNRVQGLPAARYGRWAMYSEIFGMLYACTL
eukprot:1639756-Amphidinium_carterae.1